MTFAGDGGLWASLTPQNDQVGFGSALHVLQNLPIFLTFADINSSLRCSSPQPPADGQSRYSLPCPSLSRCFCVPQPARLARFARQQCSSLPAESGVCFARCGQLSVEPGWFEFAGCVCSSWASFVSQTALEDFTLHQHIQALEDRGWTWARLPNGRVLAQRFGGFIACESHCLR